MKGNGPNRRVADGDRRETRETRDAARAPEPRPVDRGTAALAAPAARAIGAAHDDYQRRFAEITARARRRFEQRDWSGSQRDAAERLALYRRHVDEAITAVEAILGPRRADPAAWEAMKAAYSDDVGPRPDVELAETFFNSVTRRIFTTVGVDPRIEFTDSRHTRPRRTAAPPIYRTYGGGQGSGPGSGQAGGAQLENTIRRALGDIDWNARWSSLGHDAARVAAAIEARAHELWGGAGDAAPDAIDLLPTPFFRNKGAYLVGRVRRGAELFPLVLPLLHGDDGIRVDAALVTSDDASIVFGFSWSYFRVETTRPRALVDFLRTIMPLKRLDELYTAIGRNKHGKTELYRTLIRHLDAPDAVFETAEGDEGLVMSVFTLPSLNVVFKIIKDRFVYPKQTTRRAVMAKYHLVFVRDRAGRLADAQEFEHLAFRRSCFDDALLARLLADCSETVRVDGDRIVVRHLYTERRVTPLNLYLRDAPPAAAHEAILDYGNAIKDLAAANIFTGDMLRKNFGVTRHGRVIFYDYDELTLLTDCRFRRLPDAPNPEDEMAAEPWFPVGENDVFPEEFAPFLLPGEPLRSPFVAAHGDLLTPAYWEGLQRRIAAGELCDVFPYPQSRRFAPAS